MVESDYFVDRQPTKESFIFYYAWYVWLSTLSEKVQIKVFRAICEYALFDVPIPRSSFSLKVYTTLLTFKHNIDANKRNYLNGIKGGSHGAKGGRPSKNEARHITPVGFVAENPAGNLEGKGVNVDGKVNDNDNDNDESIPIPPTFNIIYQELLPIFFFRNCNAQREIRRFFDFYREANWCLRGGAMLDNKSSLHAAARRWRFENAETIWKTNFLKVWHQLYQLAPDTLKQHMLEIIRSSSQSYGVSIICSLPLHQWLNSPEIRDRVTELFSKISASYKFETIPKL